MIAREWEIAFLYGDMTDYGIPDVAVNDGSIECENPMRVRR